MALGPRLDLRQSQSLVMTPQLQQAIRLLTLSNLEIESFIAEEIEKNPLLESGGGGDDERGADRAADRGGGDDDGDWGDADGFDAPDPVTADRLIAGGDAGSDNPLDVDYAAETFHHDSALDSIVDRPMPDGPGMDGGLGLDGIGSGGMSEDGPDFDAMAADAPSLHDHLLAQAGAELSGLALLIGEQIIDQIDEAGYLAAPLAEIADRLGVPIAEAEAVLGVVQGFDPTGVGARSLAECIALQAREADRYDPAMARLIDNLDLLAQGKIAQLRRITGVDEEDMADMIRELRGYDPVGSAREVPDHRRRGGGGSFIQEGP